METVYLYNERNFLKGKLKNSVKNLLGRSFGGAFLVEKNLIIGLEHLGCLVTINKKNLPHGATACVVNGVDSLRWAITQKKAGNVKKIVAGPNIAMPGEADDIIFDDLIDVFLVPAQWVEDFCLSLKPEFKAKIRIWAAGVETLTAKSTSATGNNCLVYQKNGTAKLLNSVIKTLRNKGLAYHVLTYGSHTRQDYLDRLRQTDFLIMLAQSESQGLVLHEAWMMDVPTLVYGGGHMVYGNYEWLNSSPAPYLTPQSGRLFSSSDDFALKLEEFRADLKLFAPRAYHLENFTPEITAAKYLEIIKSL